MWYHQESNRGHKDFQSFALPTELWYQRLFADAKVKKNPILPKQNLSFFNLDGYKLSL
jgi:hypothetical protein